MKEKEEKDMAVRKDSNSTPRQQKIREIAHKIADRNDEGLRRLSKN